MNKYKNISNKDLYLPNIGLVKAGSVVETEIEINNANFEKVVNKAIEPEKDKMITKEDYKNK